MSVHRIKKKKKTLNNDVKVGVKAAPTKSLVGLKKMPVREESKFTSSAVKKIIQAELSRRRKEKFKKELSQRL